MVTSADVDTLVEQVERFLSEVEEPVSEHDLVAEFAYETAFAELKPGSAIHLQSQRHFLIMHVLYTLRERLQETGYRLQMRPDAICLLENSAADPVLDDAGELEQAEATKKAEALRDYYLDFAQLGSTESLTDEGSRQQNQTHHREPYNTLDVDAGSDWLDAQAAPGENSAENHPGSGGDAEDFHRVRMAYRELRRSVRT